MREANPDSRQAYLWARLDAERRTFDVLSHPFYVRWTCGELSTPELAGYAGQYRHAVTALADAAAQAATTAPAHTRAVLYAHAAEEYSHVALWDDFAEAVGAGPSAPLPETAVCAAAWAGADGRSHAAWLATLYAIEAAQPRIAQTKAVGLRRHYGIDGAGAEYFSVHAERDKEHAVELRGLLEDELAAAEASELIATTRRALRSNWILLDGVERLNRKGVAA